MRRHTACNMVWFGAVCKGERWKTASHVLWDRTTGIVPPNQLLGKAGSAQRSV
jgi:hypothetical protein